MKKLYKVTIGESVGLARDSWFFRARSIVHALELANKKRAKYKSYCNGWEFTSIALAGELEN